MQGMPVLFLKCSTTLYEPGQPKNPTANVTKSLHLIGFLFALYFVLYRIFKIIGLIFFLLELIFVHINFVIWSLCFSLSCNLAKSLLISFKVCEVSGLHHRISTHSCKTFEWSKFHCRITKIWRNWNDPCDKSASNKISHCHSSIRFLFIRSQHSLHVARNHRNTLRLKVQETTSL